MTKKYTITIDYQLGFNEHEIITNTIDANNKPSLLTIAKLIEKRNMSDTVNRFVWCNELHTLNVKDDKYGHIFTDYLGSFTLDMGQGASNETVYLHYNVVVSIRDNQSYYNELSTLGV